MYHHAKTWTGMGRKMAANQIPGKFKFEYTGSRCWVWIRRVYLHPTHCRNNATPTFAMKQGRNCPNIYNRSDTSLRSVFLGHLANWLHRVCITSTLNLIYIIKHCNNRSDFLWGSFETMFTGSVSHNIEDIFLTFLAFPRCALVSFATCMPCIFVLARHPRSRSLWASIMCRNAPTTTSTTNLPHRSGRQGLSADKPCCNNQFTILDRLSFPEIELPQFQTESTFFPSEKQQEGQENCTQNPYDILSMIWYRNCWNTRPSIFFSATHKIIPESYREQLNWFWAYWYH